MKKIILTVCLECGNRYDTKRKQSMGVWKGDCDICGAEDIACASAPHDFGIYSNEQIKKEDQIQDAI